MRELTYNSLRRFNDHVRDFPVRENEFVQLGRGQLVLMNSVAYGKTAIAFSVKCAAHSSWTTLADPEWIAFMAPVSWRGDYQINGFIARPNEIFYLDGKVEYHSVGEQRNVVFLAMRRDRLAAELSALHGGLQVGLPDGHRKIGPSKPASGRLRALVYGALYSTHNSSMSASQSVMHPAVEADLITRTAQWLYADVPWYSEQAPRQSRTIDHVRAAREMFEAIAPETLSVPLLCKAAGVRETQLHEAFLEIYGIAPWKYVKRRRLTAMREAFSNAQNPPRSVKEIALTYGFLSSGKAAKEYLALFGELPSETLRNTKKLSRS